MKKVLVVAYDFPYLPKYGGRVDMWNRIRALKRLGITADLITTVKTMPTESEVREVRSHVRELTILPRKIAVKALFSLQPLSVTSRSSLSSIHLADDYCAVILEGEHVLSILDNPQLKARKVVLRLQNNESRYHNELSKTSTNILRKVFYKVESYKFRVFSPAAMARCDALWFISRSEQEEYRSKYQDSSEKAMFVPPPVALSEINRHKLETNTVLFVGWLGFATNMKGVKWYLEQVHKFLFNIDDYQFILAGNTEGLPRDSLGQILASYSRTGLIENPKSLNDIYDAASVFVNPVFNGAGLKLKTINAIQAGLPVVSTSVGIEGTGLTHGKHVLVGETPQAFSDAVRKLLLDRAYAENMVLEAQEFLRREYDLEKAVEGSTHKLTKQFDSVHGTS